MADEPGVKKGANIKELLAQAEALQAKIASMRSEQKQSGIEQILAIMDELQIKPEDLGYVSINRLPPSQRHGPTWQKAIHSNPGVPVYRDPASGRTWSGRGRVPEWMGENRDDFLIR